MAQLHKANRPNLEHQLDGYVCVGLFLQEPLGWFRDLWLSVFLGTPWLVFTFEGRNEVGLEAICRFSGHETWNGPEKTTNMGMSVCVDCFWDDQNGYVCFWIVFVESPLLALTRWFCRQAI